MFADVEMHRYDFELWIDLGSSGVGGVDGVLEVVLSMVMREAMSSLFTFDGGMKAQEEGG